MVQDVRQVVALLGGEDLELLGKRGQEKGRGGRGELDCALHV